MGFLGEGLGRQEREDQTYTMWDRTMEQREDIKGMTKGRVLFMVCNKRSMDKAAFAILSSII